MSVSEAKAARATQAQEDEQAGPGGLQQWDEGEGRGAAEDEDEVAASEGEDEEAAAALGGSRRKRRRRACRARLARLTDPDRGLKRQVCPRRIPDRSPPEDA